MLILQLKWLLWEEEKFKFGRMEKGTISIYLSFIYVKFDIIVFSFVVNVPFCGLFCPEDHAKVIQKITEIYEGKYDAAYPSWSKISQSVCDMWFNELKISNLQFLFKVSTIPVVWCMFGCVLRVCDPLSCLLWRLAVELLKNRYVVFHLYKFIYKALNLGLVQF